MAETIAAVSTPSGEGGIGIVRISGELAISVADKVFKSFDGRTLTDINGYSALYGAAYDNAGKIDEVVALKFAAPKSYTGEDVIELSCHGGSFVVKRLLRAVFAAGAVPAEAGEFTKRAFLNGKLDLSRAESVANIISASGEQALHFAVKGKDGAIFKAISAIKDSLLHSAARIAVFSDYPDEEPEFSGIDLLETELNSVIAQLEQLIKNYDAGKVYKSGIDTVIVGKPNVGKSTLMNLLSGQSRSIVTEIAGTTRDVIEETVMLDDIKLCLADTAGLHDTEDIVESIGVERSKERLKTAELVLAVFDASEEFTEADKEVLALCRDKKCIVLLNKIDKGNNGNNDFLSNEEFPIVEVSAKNRKGIDELIKAVQEQFYLNRLDENSVVLAGERQYNCVNRAMQSVVSAKDALNEQLTLDAVGVCIDDALAALMELTGERVTNAVADEVFKHFCVGK